LEEFLSSTTWEKNAHTLIKSALKRVVPGLLGEGEKGEDLLEVSGAK